MSDLKNNKSELMLAIQLDLFNTKKINLSALYTAMPLETKPTDSRIARDSDGNVKAAPITEIFTVDKKPSKLVKLPAIYTSRKTKETVVQFPYMREAKVEGAILTLLAKKNIEYRRDHQNNTSFYLHTSIYAIRKEIVDAINTYRKNREKPLSVENCPLNHNDVIDALQVLSNSKYKLENPDVGDINFTFSRIKDVYQKDENFTIEIGAFVSQSIEEGGWNTLEPTSLLASTEFYEYRLKVLLFTNFRNARKEETWEFKGEYYKKPYTASLEYIIDKIQYSGYVEPSKVIQVLKKICKKMSEIEIMLVDPKKDGRKITAASLIHFVPTDDFVSNVIENNILSRRSKEQRYIFDAELEEHHIEPVRSEYETDHAYKQAQFEYKKRKWQYIAKSLRH